MFASSIHNLLLVILISFTNADTDKIFCYYGSWATYRIGAGKFEVQNIDTSLCTHFVYASIGVDTAGNVIPIDKDNDIRKGSLLEFSKLKQKSSSIKTLVSLGGWNEGSKKYSNIVKNTYSRNILVESIASFLREYQFDGISIDWQYPTGRGGTDTDYAGFFQLLKEIRIKLGGSYLLTALINYKHVTWNIDIVNNLNSLLDYVQIMTYEYNDGFGAATAHSSPLQSSKSNNNLNINDTINSLLNIGILREKIILGLSSYGISYRLTNPKMFNVGASSQGPGNAGLYTAEAGMLSYLEICEKQRNEDWSVSWDESQRNPYMYKQSGWISYDDARSSLLKAQFAIDRKLGGVFIWTIDSDDGKNVCGGGKFPLSAAIKSAFEKTPSTPAPTQCEPFSIKRDPQDCSSYYVCAKTTDGSFSLQKKQCSHGLYFDITRNLCNHPSAVAC